MAGRELDLLRDGVLLRREAVEAGVDDHALIRAVRSGVLIRIRQGIYADATSWPTLSPEARLQLLRIGTIRLYGPSTLISHDTAVLLHGGPAYRLDLDRVHLTYEGAHGRTQARVVHHAGRRSSDDLPCSPAGWVRSPARCFVESVARKRSVEVGVVLFSHALRHGLASIDQLWAARESTGTSAGSLPVRSALALADGRLDSVAEARCWYLLRRKLDLPDIVPQYEVADSWGNVVAVVDFAIPEWGVIIEFDGLEKYAGRRRRGETVVETVLREKQRETTVAELTGWEFCRLTWTDLAFPDLVRERIQVVARRQAARSSRAS